jgi:periplasmic protein CpxP/Spy
MNFLSIVNLRLMNFFSKNKILFWIMVVLIVVNVATITTFLVYVTNKPVAPENPSAGKAGAALQSELSLTPAQNERVTAILDSFRNATGPIADSARANRIGLLDELAKDNPDSFLLNRYAERISFYQSAMQKSSIRRYLQLKGLCSPEQCRRLSDLYFEMYGCQGKCKQQGKGMMHQNRRGKHQGGFRNHPSTTE